MLIMFSIRCNYVLSFRWEQEISFFVMNVLLASKVLRKGDCAKNKEFEHREIMAREVIKALSEKELEFEENDTGFVLRRKQVA